MTFGITSGTNMPTLSFTNGGLIEARRQINGAEGLDGGAANVCRRQRSHGQFAQVLFFRNARERLFRVKALNGVSIIDRRASLGDDNSGDWSANLLRFGWAGGLASSANAENFASPRGFVASAADWWINR